MKAGKRQREAVDNNATASGDEQDAQSASHISQSAAHISQAASSELPYKIPYNALKEALLTTGSYQSLYTLKPGAPRAGQFGLVYEALSRSTGGSVAVKVLKPDYYNHRDTNEAEKRRRTALREPFFLQRACQQGQHANLLTFFSAHEEDNVLADAPGQTLVVCTTYAPGDNMSVYFQRVYGNSLPSSSSPPTSPARLLRECDVAAMMRTILNAIAHLHARDILHLDIKPWNCLVRAKPGEHFDPDRDLIVCDVGMAALECEMAERDFYEKYVNDHRGTLGFHAPEQVHVGLGPPSKASDVWSLGCLAFYLLTWDFPFGVWYYSSQRTAGGISLAPLAVPLHGMASAPTADKLYHPSHVREAGPRKDTADMWDELSSEAQHFIRCCLMTAPAERMKVDELLQHPWITGDVQPQSQTKYNQHLGKTQNRIYHAARASHMLQVFSQTLEFAAAAHGVFAATASKQEESAHVGGGHGAGAAPSRPQQLKSAVDAALRASAGSGLDTSLQPLTSLLSEAQRPAWAGLVEQIKKSSGGGGCTDNVLLRAALLAIRDESTSLLDFISELAFDERGMLTVHSLLSVFKEAGVLPAYSLQPVAHGSMSTAMPSFMPSAPYASLYSAMPSVRGELTVQPGWVLREVLQELQEAHAGSFTRQQFLEAVKRNATLTEWMSRPLQRFIG